jgi:hypothetical protein
MKLLRAKSLIVHARTTRHLLLTTALFAMGCASSAPAGTIYTYIGHNYTLCAGTYCTGGPYALSATFATTLSGSALDNLPFTAITPTVISFVFTDGSGLSIDQNTGGARTSISISTDGSGNIVSWLAGAYANSAEVQMQTNWHSPFGFIPGADFSETTAFFAGSYGFVGNNPGTWTITPDPASGTLLGSGLLGLLALAARKKHQAPRVLTS